MDSDGDGMADAEDADMVNPAVSIPLQVSQLRLPQQLARIPVLMPLQGMFAYGWMRHIQRLWLVMAPMWTSG